jgi:predicted peptidase
MPDLESLVDHMRTLPSVDPQRVYLTGFSMGGYGAWGLAARRPDLFAAVVPICGGGDPRWGQALAAVPIWAVHGADDDVVPVRGSRDMIAAIRLAGGQPRYTELPGVRHDSWPQTYGDPQGVVPWMFDQVNQQRPRQVSPGQ